MTNLKNLTFTEVPKKMTDPTVRRRDKLLERLQEQINLAKDPSYVVKSHKWEKDDSGTKVRVEVDRKVQPWWFTDIDGQVYLTVKVGYQKIEFEKGKSAIKVGSVDKLPSVLNTIVAATQSGELDKLFPTNRYNKSIGSK